ncbi:MAG: IMP dehydrogenase [Planctomycetes bacterium]|nr:IMP dehydrogenase [Planctomycetota bacterium]
MHDRIVGEGITFDDVLLLPGYSEIVPSEINPASRFTRNVGLRIPICSAAMDTVTEAALAIALGYEGGIGVIHKNMPPADQAREVYQVKRTVSGVIVDPVTLAPDATVGQARQLMASHRISGLPIVDSERRVVGILTARDLRFHKRDDERVSAIMTTSLVTRAPGTTPEQAKEVLHQRKVEKLILVDADGRLAGLITIKDINKLEHFPNANIDGEGRLRVAAAVGVRDDDRVEHLVAAQCDVIVVDTAHGHSKNVIEAVKRVKAKYPQVDVVAGNVATYDGAKALVDAGADAVKVGIGPGSICTTRVISGVGVPQLTAITSAVEACRPAGVPVIADGGIRYSGDITKAIAAGADSVMAGSLFAGLEESPGETILYRGRTFKQYRGMGSIGAMVQGSADRYGQGGQDQKDKLVPEGVEGRVPSRGRLSPFVYQLVGGLRAGMGYVGARNVTELQQKARFVKITGASLRENHPHDISITREAPNYQGGEFDGTL